MFKPRHFPNLNVLAATLGLAACAAVGATSSIQVKPQDDQFVADGALDDLYDYILVETDAGAQTPRVVDADAAAEVLKNYDVIFIGEIHHHPANHKAQMDLFRAVYQQSPNLSLSLEQFERDVQSVVDDYLAGKIGETPLRQKGRAWDNYPVSYRPLVEYAKDHQLPVIAAEVPTDIVRCVGEAGPDALERLPAEQRPWAAATLHLDAGPYRDKFMKFLGGNPTHGRDEADSEKIEGPSPAALRSFAAQVTRDDTMAESIYLHLLKNPGRKVVHLNGSFHSESFLGTAERLQWRDPNLKIAVVNPLEVEDSSAPSFAKDDVTTGTFVLLIKSAPQAYTSEAEMTAAVTAEMAERRAANCPI